MQHYYRQREKIKRALKSRRRHLSEGEVKNLSVKVMDKFLTQIFKDMLKSAEVSAKKNKKILDTVDVRGNKINPSDLSDVVDDFVDHLKVLIDSWKTGDSSEELEDLLADIIED